MLDRLIQSFIALVIDVLDLSLVTSAEMRFYVNGKGGRDLLRKKLSGAMTLSKRERLRHFSERFDIEVPDHKLIGVYFPGEAVSFDDFITSGLDQGLTLIGGDETAHRDLALYLLSNPPDSWFGNREVTEVIIIDSHFVEGDGIPVQVTGRDGDRVFTFQTYAHRVFPMRPSATRVFVFRNAS